jgi:hypothetical protein
VEAFPGLRRRCWRRVGGRDRGERAQVVGERRVSFHIRPEVLPVEVVAVVLRLHLVLGALPFSTPVHGSRQPPSSFRSYLVTTSTQARDARQPMEAQAQGEAGQVTFSVRRR